MRTVIRVLIFPLLMSAPLWASMFQVVLDTTLLKTNAASPFYFEFQLNDGSGTSDGNNTATLSNFNFGGGSAGSSLNPTGGVSGDITTFLKIVDNSFFNQYFQDFTPGNRLSFFVNLTERVDSGTTPDQFSFAVFDCSQSEIPTTSPANALLSVNIDGTNRIQTFAGNPGIPLACNGAPGIAVPAPNAVPEPRTAALTLAFLAAGIFLSPRRIVP